MVHYRWNTVTDNILCEQDDAGELLATYTQEPSLYGELISQRRDGQTSYYHFDGQGSTRELTDQNQDVTDTYIYDAFGVEVAKTETTTNPFRYQGVAGYYTDVSTSEIYVRSRTFDVQRARWRTIDPFGFADGPNYYVYVSNNPVNANDPSGWRGIKFCYPGTKSCIGHVPESPQGPPLSSLPPPPVSKRCLPRICVYVELERKWFIESCKGCRKVGFTLPVGPLPIRGGTQLKCDVPLDHPTLSRLAKCECRWRAGVECELKCLDPVSTRRELRFDTNVYASSNTGYITESELGWNCHAPPPSNAPDFPKCPTGVYLENNLPAAPQIK